MISFRELYERDLKKDELDGPPHDDEGRVELTHWANDRHSTLDPKKQGTGPVRGVERRRLFGDHAVPRTYYGVATGQSGGYQKEAGLGAVKHVAYIHKDHLYDYNRDPDKLRSKVGSDVVGADRETHYEKHIHDAGYHGYYSRAEQGMTAAVFKPLTPAKVEGAAVRRVAPSFVSGGSPRR